MNNEQMEKQEHLKKAQENYEQVLRRKRIEMYKKMIIITFCVVSVLPSIFSICLLHQVSDMEEQVSYLAGQKDAENNARVDKIKNKGDNIADDEQLVKETQAGVIRSQENKRVYLTFDDGPSDHIDEILDILDANGVKATFFVIAHTDENSMNAYRRIVEEGHGIGIHSYTHEYDKIYKSLDAFKKDVTNMSDLIYAATGIRTKLYRFPGGSANTVCSTSMNSLISWLNEEGYIYYDWNALNGDAVTKNLSVDTLIQNVISGVEKNGDKTSIVLMHDLASKSNTVKSLEPLIQQLKEKGYVMDEPLTADVPPIQQKTIKSGK